MNLFLGLAELLLSFSSDIWKRQKVLSVLVAFAWTANILWLIYESISKKQLFISILAFIAIYQIFNLYRGLKSSIKTKHLRKITITSAFRLWLIQIFIALAGLLLYYLDPSYNIELALSVFAYVLGLSLLASTWRSFKVSQGVHSSTKLIENEFPTLSVAIPARNETDSLINCLSSLLANDYPKLEIFVYDDNSTTRRTSEIIRSFAHDGVEFIPGTPFNEEWIAKNWAYQQLLEVANGELILFCGADTRFSSDSLRFLVSSLISRDKQMISIVPNNEFPGSFWQRFWQPLRYAWEVCIPRRSLQRPPVLPTCWLARRDFINNLGGFKAVSRRISPESYFATHALKSDGYSFFQYPDILSQKQPDEQFETSIRLRYPQLRRQTESVMFASLVEILGGLSAIALIFLSLISLNATVLTLSI
ncbi:MAG: glycosyltransferase, partial [Candidatus Saccharimonadales bacterium]